MDKNSKGIFMTDSVTLVKTFTPPNNPDKWTSHIARIVKS